MKIAVLKKDIDTYLKGKIFVIDNEYIYINNNIFCSVGSDTEKYYFDIKECNKILEKQCTNEKIRYIFDDDTKTIIKQNITPIGDIKEKYIDKPYNQFYIELLKKDYQEAI